MFCAGCGIEDVDVQREMSRWLVERADEQNDQHITQAPQVGDQDGVLEPREGRLAGEAGALGQGVSNEFEDGDQSQRVVVILIFEVGQDVIDSLPAQDNFECSTEVGSRRSWRPAANRSVSRIRWSSGRIGGSPVSVGRRAEENSISTGWVGKKWNDKRGIV